LVASASIRGGADGSAAEEQARVNCTIPHFLQHTGGAALSYAHQISPGGVFFVAAAQQYHRNRAYLPCMGHFFVA
jgi:hypothetical protein